MADADERYAVPLDGDLIKTLASDTRRKILHLLRKRRMTLSEMARALDLTKATVLDHLRRLDEAGLVHRLEDDRMWVYYELSHQGDAILSPQRTRVYLVVGMGVLALVAGLLIGLALTGPALLGPSPLAVPEGAGSPDAPAQDGVARESGSAMADAALSLDLAEREVLADPSGQFVTYASVDGVDPSGAETRAYLVPSGTVTARDASLLATGGSAAAASASAIPLDLRFTGEPGRVALSAPPGMEPGTYFVLVTDGEGRDNRRAMPRLSVHAVDAQVSNVVWWRGLDGAVDVRITMKGPGGGLEGTLALLPHGTDPAAGPAIGPADPVLVTGLVNGSARLGAARLDGVPPGAYAIRVQPEGRSSHFRLDARLEVQDPDIQVTPRDVLAGVAGEVRLAADPGAVGRLPAPVYGGETLRPPGAADGGANGTAGGEDSGNGNGNGTDTGTGSAASAPTYALPARDPGTYALRVGRLFDADVRVHPNLSPTVRLVNTTDELAYELALAGPNGTPVPGIAVHLDGAPWGLTNASGRVRASLPAPGEHLLTLVAPDGSRVERPLLVQGWNATEPVRRLGVRADPEPDGTLIRVRATVRNDEPVAERTTLVATLDDRLATARLLDLAPGTEQEVVLEAAAGPGTHRVAVHAEAVPRPALRFVNATGGPNGSGGGTDAELVDSTPEDGEGAGGDGSAVTVLQPFRSAGASEVVSLSAPAVPSLRVVEVDVAPVAVMPGEAFVLAATVENPGPDNATAVFEVLVDGEANGTLPVLVEGGSERTFARTLVLHEPGQRTITVGGASTTISVGSVDGDGGARSNAEQPAVPAPGPVLVAASAAIAALWVARRQRRDG